jgi:hypothetical protein
MKFEYMGTPATEVALSAAEAETGLRFPPGLRDYFLHTNGGAPDLCVFRRNGSEADALAVQECLPLEGRWSAMGTYRRVVLEWKAVPPYFFPFAIDPGGNVLFVDCRSDEGNVVVWWHDVPGAELDNLRVGIRDFWSYLVKE